ncbi:MAG TPA: class I SAM-dependent methyltransferase [Casimicrobiaceae bacterium]|nr:class I SAM-dependent methyltransferase [Casimicrobiaceae bacterium]
MLVRIRDFFSFFGLDDAQSALGRRHASHAAKLAENMMDIRDYEALGAIALHVKPQRIFEIGTYLGVTSDFLLALLPSCEVVSIAYVNPRFRYIGRRYNNSELPRNEIGSAVAPERQKRFTQLYGDSHQLDAKALVAAHGLFDLVLIDGDHSRDGVRTDTELAHAVLGPDGAICWHDANPKPVYRDVRTFLERELALRAVATEDEYTGGIAMWNRDVGTRLDAVVGRGGD